MLFPIKSYSPNPFVNTFSFSPQPLLQVTFAALKAAAKLAFPFQTTKSFLKFFSFLFPAPGSPCQPAFKNNRFFSKVRFSISKTSKPRGLFSVPFRSKRVQNNGYFFTFPNGWGKFYFTNETPSC